MMNWEVNLQPLCCWEVWSDEWWRGRCVFRSRRWCGNTHSYCWPWCDTPHILVTPNKWDTLTVWRSQHNNGILRKVRHIIIMSGSPIYVGVPTNFRVEEQAKQRRT